MFSGLDRGDGYRLRVVSTISPTESARIRATMRSAVTLLPESISLPTGKTLSLWSPTRCGRMPSYILFARGFIPTYSCVKILSTTCLGSRYVLICAGLLLLSYSIGMTATGALNGLIWSWYWPYPLSPLLSIILQHAWSRIASSCETPCTMMILVFESVSRALTHADDSTHDHGISVRLKVKLSLASIISCASWPGFS